MGRQRQRRGGGERKLLAKLAQLSYMYKVEIWWSDQISHLKKKEKHFLSTIHFLVLTALSVRVYSFDGL